MLLALAEAENRFQTVSEMLTDPEVVVDQDRVKSLSKEYKELARIADAGKTLRMLKGQLESAREIIQTEPEGELKDMAREEVESLEPKLAEHEEKLKMLLIPRDPDDSKDCIMEVRAGTGGDEASLFAGDIFRMYQRFAERKGFKFEVTEVSEGTMGGFKEIIISISGEDAFGTLKYESGVHRVQRVPDTETQGRIHTSAASVVVMPEAEELDITLNMNEIRKDTFCSQGAGGQSVNTTYSAVRLTHLPTGVTVSMQNERSQIKNYDIALKILKTRLYDLERQKRDSAEAAIRKTMVAGGDRSAKIRTYNYPQSRVTDHRIGFTMYNLPMFMAGDLDDMIDALKLAENTQRMNERSTATN
jgi:peptide chain release factor 1